MKKNTVNSVINQTIFKTLLGLAYVRETCNMYTNNVYKKILRNPIWMRRRKNSSSLFSVSRVNSNTSSNPTKNSTCSIH